MSQKEIELLDKQIAKLDIKGFDLEAWKSSTVHLLTLLFGSTDPKIKDISDLKIDYGSWALRDSGADYKPLESCKKKGWEILDVARDELVLKQERIGDSNINEKLKGLLSKDQFEKFNSNSSTENERIEVLKSLTKNVLINVILDSR